MTTRVLIADTDAERSRRIVEACTRHGLVCSTSSQGAEALEIALADMPAAVLATLDLPLIDGPKLAAILHANPRTQGIGVLFLCDSEADAERDDLDGQVLPPGADPDTVARCLQAFVVHRESSGAAQADEEGGVEGQLAHVSVADLLQLFHANRRTGTLELDRTEPHGRAERGRILLRGGEVVQAAVGSVEAEKALYRLLAWERGRFAFKPSPVNIEPTIQKPTRDLLREGLRQLKEWERLKVDLPPREAQVTLKIRRSALPNVIHPLTQEVLLVLESYSTVRDVVDHCAYPDYQVMRTLQTLIERDIVELRRESGLAEVAGELFTATDAARLREWVDLARPRGEAARDAKLVVVASDAEALRALLRLLGRIHGVEIDEGTAEGVGADHLGRLGRIAVDADLGIELVQLPAKQLFAPLWPLATHGALGVLLVLSGPVAEAVEALEGVRGVLGKLPRARLLHILLLQKGDRLTPEELRKHLSLMDEASLFLIPLEGAEEAPVLLREMLGRLLP